MATRTSKATGANGGRARKEKKYSMNNTITANRKAVKGLKMAPVNSLRQQIDTDSFTGEEINKW